MFLFRHRPSPSGGCWLTENVLLWLGRLPRGLPPADFSAHEAADLHLLGFAKPTKTAAAKRLLDGLGIATASAATYEKLRPLLSARALDLSRQALAWPRSAAAELTLATTLLELRQFLRPRPAAASDGKLPRVCVDTLLRADSRTFFIRGWWRATPAFMRRFDIISPEGARVDALAELHRMPRGDLAARFPGEDFTAFRGTFALPHSSPLDHGWLVDWETSDGERGECEPPVAIRQPPAALDAVLSDVGLEEQVDGAGVAPVIDRFVQPLLAAGRADARITREHRFGPPPLAPEISVLVPLYARLDFVEHQFLQFSRDPDLRRCELLYLLDSPEIEAQSAALLEECVELYGVSARLLVANRNCGYALINNLGAACARAPLLVFLNSDAIPIRPGWLSQLAGFYRRRVGIGALGPKLVFEDGSLQHAGEQFRLRDDGRIWETVPCFKGMHRSFPPANLARPVAAVTGACLMISRPLFSESGGFDEGYVQGDFEDSDLCLRLASRGLQNWYCPDAELHHFEGASYPGAERARNFVYNQWRHSRRWHRTLESLAAAVPAPSARHSAA